MAIPELTVDFEGLVEATKGTSCYDAKQPWWVQVSLANANPNPAFPEAVDPTNPTAPAGPFTVRLEVMKGPKIASGTAYTSEATVDGLGSYPATDDQEFLVGIAVKLPVAVKVDDLGVKRAFRITVDSKNTVAESNENDNVYVWENGTKPPLATDTTMDPAAPEFDEDLSFSDTAAVPGSDTEIDVLVRNVGPQTSVPLSVRLSVYGDPSPASPVGAIIGGGHSIAEPLEPGASHWVRITSDTPFLHPHSAPVARIREPYVLRDEGTAQFRLRTIARDGRLTIRDYTTVHADTGFDVLRHFTISLYSGFGTIGFSPPGRGTSGGGHIRIPVK